LLYLSEEKRALTNANVQRQSQAIQVQKTATGNFFTFSGGATKPHEVGNMLLTAENINS